MIAPFLHVDKFFLLNFIGETFLCSLNFIFMCSAVTNCVDKLLEINCFQNLFTVVTSAEAIATTLNEKIHKLTITKEKNIEFIFLEP